MLATFKYIHIDKNSKSKRLFSYSFNCKFSNSQLIKKMFFWLSEQVKLDIGPKLNAKTVISLCYSFYHFESEIIIRQ